MAEFVRLEVEDGVGTIRIDRPKMNALDVQAQEEIRACAVEAATRDDVRAVIVYGGERVFAAGADVKEMAEMSYTDMVARSGGLQSAFTAVARIPKPVVAAVTGYALGGGCELAMCADIRIAGESATLGQPEIPARHHPGGRRYAADDPAGRPGQGQGHHLQRPLRQGRRGAAIGLVDQVVADDQVYAAAQTWARQFSKAAAFALRAAKESIDRGLEVDLETGLEIERVQFAALFATEDRTMDEVVRAERSRQGGVPGPLVGSAMVPPTHP